MPGPVIVLTVTSHGSENRRASTFQKLKTEQSAASVAARTAHVRVVRVPAPSESLPYVVNIYVHVTDRRV